MLRTDKMGVMIIIPGGYGINYFISPIRNGPEQ